MSFFNNGKKSEAKATGIDDYVVAIDKTWSSQKMNSEVSSLMEDLTQHQLDYTEQQNLDNLKVVKVEKELNNYQNVMNQISNVGTKQNITGSGTVNLPDNATKGQIGVTIKKGKSYNNELNYNRDTWAEWNKVNCTVANQQLRYQTVSNNNKIADINTSFKPNTKYGLLLNIAESQLTSKHVIMGDNLTGKYENLYYYFDPIGNKKFVFTTKSALTDNRFKLYVSAVGIDGIVTFKDIRIFELPTGSEIETDFNTLSIDELANKYPYTQSGGTVEPVKIAGRVTSKNIDETEQSNIYYMAKDENGNMLQLTGYTVDINRKVAIADGLEYPIEIDGTIISYPNGRVYIEPFVSDKGIYTDKFNISQPDLIIKEIEKIIRIDFITGREIGLDKTKAVIAIDKKSFTHPDLSSKDIVFVSYSFDKLGQEELDIEYFIQSQSGVDGRDGEIYFPRQLEDSTSNILSKITTDTTNYDFIFPLITDSHAMDDAKVTHQGRGDLHCRSIAEFSHLYPIDLAVHCGDMVYDYVPKPDFVRNISRNIKEMRRVINAPVMIAQGNHDTGDDYYWNQYNWGGWSGEPPTPDKVITPTEWARLIGYDSSFVYGDYSKSYYYKDFEDKKIRVIVLNTSDTWFLDEQGRVKYNRTDISNTAYGFKQEQLSWLANTALNFEGKTGYSAIIISHAPFNISGTSRDVQNGLVALSIIQARKNRTTYSSTPTTGEMAQSISVDYTISEQVDIIGCFHGHNHNDTIVTTQDIKIINTAWSRNPDNDLDGTWDLICIDRLGRQVKLKRFGTRGTDREFTY